MSSHNKKQVKDKRRRLQRIRRERPWPSFLPPNSQIVRDPPGEAKMSEVLLDLVEPYLESAQTEDALRKLLTVATVAWNAALMGPEECEEVFQDTEKVLPPEAREAFRVILGALIQRKLELFPDITRMIINYKLTMGTAGPYVEVMSTLPME